MTPSRDSSYKPGSAKIRRRQTRPARIGRLSSHLIRLALHHRNVVQSILLVPPFGKGFDERNLRHMRDFYQSFPIWNAVRSELSWTHYRTLLRVEDPNARHWYMNEVAIQNWSTRALERQIGTLYYERPLASQDRPAVKQEATSHIERLNLSPRDIVRDPVVLEFLGMPNAGALLETDLEQALRLDNQA